jgi:hypothetical protein
MAVLDISQAGVCDGVPASVASLMGQHDYTLSEWHEAQLRMMRSIELKRRGFQFMPQHAIKRALRQYIHRLKRQDPPEYWAPMVSIAPSSHFRDAQH